MIFRSFLLCLHCRRQLTCIIINLLTIYLLALNENRVPFLKGK